MNPIKIERKSYFSPSQINSFIERRDQYVRNYVLGAKWKGNSSFGRGNAVEYGLNCILSGMDIGEAAEGAWKYYQSYIVNEDLSEQDARKITEEDIVNSVIKIGNYYMDDLGAGPHVTQQENVNLTRPDLPRRLYGKLDYRFPPAKMAKQGSVRDLKTAAKSPSVLSGGYKLTGTVYHLATGDPVFFDYVWNLKGGAKVKTIPLTQEDIAEFTPIIISACKAMENFWDLVPEVIDEDYVEAFEALAFPNVHGMWNQDERSAAIKEWCHDKKD